MRYAIFSDIHANLEALEAVLAKIDELAQEEPIEQIWFLGDLVGYGPDPNECILKLRERTDVIIAGNHDWAAVGKIDLEDFSAAARISAEWTAEQLSEEHRTFLTNLPERVEIDECTLVHGSPYGPLWEYLTSEVLAERSFQYFSSRYCLVGHTHVPIIFQQPDTFSNAPTLPLHSDEPATAFLKSNGIDHYKDENDDETAEMVVVQSPIQQSTLSATIAGSAASAFKLTDSGNEIEDEVSTIREEELTRTPDEESVDTEDVTKVTEEPEATISDFTSSVDEEISSTGFDDVQKQDASSLEEHSALTADIAVEPEKADFVTSEDSDRENQNALVQVQDEDASISEMENRIASDSGNASVGEMNINESIDTLQDEDTIQQIVASGSEDIDQDVVNAVHIEETGSQDLIDRADAEQATHEIDLEPIAADTDDQLSGEIEELLTLLGLSQSMIEVTNEMITPTEGQWEASDGYRAIINPGGVGQPRDGDPRAAFMIYDTEHGFEFYRVPYPFEKTQEKIIKAGLPQYLAVRLEYGR
jgi:diadenosine tetraphosphatase ApaH/serine/threonine PP2A family protein phosphatase